MFATALSLVCLLCSANFASASQIPAGYVLVPAEAFFGNESPDAILAADVSTAKSSVRVNDEIGYVGEDYSLVTVTLRDNSGRPAGGLDVSLISSRATDSVEAINPISNSNGEALFRIAAAEEGVSALTAIVDGQAILERPRIVFLSKAGGIGGSLLRAELPAENDVSDVFTNQVAISFPDTVEADTPTDITITIHDPDGEVAEDFLGTVEFVSSDGLAILPHEYVFVELDRGTHTFANAVTFATPGLQTLTVSGDASLGSQEITVSVGEEGGGIAGIETPVITSPADGAVLNEAISLAGLAPSNSNLVVFVDGQFFQNTESDFEGSFLKEIALTDGRHEITVGVLRDDGSVGAVSEATNINLDQSTPFVESIVLDPGNRIVVGETTQVAVESEPELKSVLFRIGDESVDLVESVDLGTYVGEFTAPAEGTYFAEVELEDAAGNIGEYPEATSILVISAITINEVKPTSRDGRIDLRWDPPTNSDSVVNYEILYGRSESSLDNKFTTSDNRTAWFIDELNNGTTYFFKVVSLDAYGKQNGGSEVFSATPATSLVTTNCDSRVILKWSNKNSSIANYRLDYGVASGDYAESRLLPDGSSRAEWEIRDLVNGTEYFFALRGVDDFGSVVADLGETSATPQAGLFCESSDSIQLFQRQDADGDPVLMWNAIPGATSYRVYAGTQPNTYDLATVEVTSTAFRPGGLLANTGYYFAVSAVFPGSHSSANLSNAVRVEVGPAEILLIAILTALAGSYLWRRKLARG